MVSMIPNIVLSVPIFYQNIDTKALTCTFTCRSLEPLTGLAVWSDETVIIELEKGAAGLGFSILDYQVCVFDVCVCELSVLPVRVGESNVTGIVGKM